MEINFLQKLLRHKGAIEMGRCSYYGVGHYKKERQKCLKTLEAPEQINRTTFSSFRPSQTLKTLNKLTNAQLQK